MTTAAQRQSALEEAHAAIERAIRELETARMLMKHATDAGTQAANDAIDESFSHAHRARRELVRLR